MISGKSAATVFDEVMLAGAYMHLAKPVSFEQILLAIGGVYRRSANASGAGAAWRLDEARGVPLAPDGVPVALSLNRRDGAELPAGSRPVRQSAARPWQPARGVGPTTT